MSEHVIRSVVSHIRRQTRDTDILARWSEDVFAILATETRQADAAKLAAKLMEIMDHTVIDNFGLISISCGVTEYRRDDNVDNFTDRSVEALRLARERGGNRFEVL
jgi:diguanylate cyclase (GGDEF)-like protein